jgi:hypothetical protein
MKKKLTILLFGLLLAVGWANDASAQLKRGVSENDAVATLPTFVFAPEQDREKADAPEDGGPITRMNAPRRGHSDVNANEVHYTKADYANIKYTWYEGETTSATAHPNTPLTEPVPADKPYQMYWLLRSVYMDTDVPGILYNDVYQEATQYYGIDYGWNIGDITSPEIEIELTNQYGRILRIELYDANNTSTPFVSWTAGNNLPNGWFRTTANMTNTSDGLYWDRSSGGHIVIPVDFYSSHTNGIKVRVLALGTSSSTSCGLYINSRGWASLSTSATNYSRDITNLGRKSITAPDYNAYTVFLIKVKDYAGTLTPSMMNTSTTSDLITLFSNYIDGIELLTDGLRVGEENGQPTETAGTVFAYRGVLNRFYFIGKGKTATHKSTSTAASGFGANGPFYEMYEEFSPTTTDLGVQTQDFYTDMHGGNYYPVVHDCATVLGYEHFFSMYGHDTTVYKSVSPIVLYIPDLRSRDGYRTYEEGHQPQVGLYTIKLTAETEPVADYSDPDNRNYIVYLDWTSSLNQMVNNTVDQTYVIYTVTYDPVTNAPIYHYLATVDNETTYEYIVPQQQSSQQIEYVVMGYPTNATNNPDPNNGGVEGGIFFTYSDPDDVQIPGWFDFMILYRERYESDFVIQEEQNYYRNYLYPTNLSPGTGMTMEQLKKEWPNQTASYTLWRNDQGVDKGVAKLEIRAIGDKVYYRIRYYKDTQVTTGPNAIGVDGDKTSGNAKMPYNYVELPNDNN